MKPNVVIKATTWVRSGHLGNIKEVDYEIFLNGVRLRGFSTHGSMSEGYWGNRAKSEAFSYALAVANTLGTFVTLDKTSRG